MTASPALPRTSREVQLTAVPDGLPRPEHLRVVAQPLPRPGEGEVLVRNTYFQVFPALRTLMGGGAEGAGRARHVPAGRQADHSAGGSPGRTTRRSTPNGSGHSADGCAPVGSPFRMYGSRAWTRPLPRRTR
ncbi:hypothetical protein [Streptomyces sp. NPDC048565]|uniref:hypothetical protein n=1 Tax=Streptomyces sp. NPDC048565 TaxID=3155266 RepID=UPI003437FB42